MATESEQLVKAILHEALASYGRKGGKARLKTMTPEQRHIVAKKAAAERWYHDKPVGNLNPVILGIVTDVRE